MQFLSGRKREIGFTLGIVAFGMFIFLPVPEGLSHAGWKTAAVGILMAVWWIAEPIPIPVTALLPLVLFPILDISSIGAAAEPYANPLIFLFMGGFIIAIAMQSCNLHRRIALNILRWIGINPASIIIGFIIASSFLSMWVSNTATALMMLPIALSILELLKDINFENHREKSNFEIALLLSIAYACNIGGMATLIGTPPNALLSGFMYENYNFEIGFAQWMLVGVPLMFIALPVMFIVLTKIVYPLTIKELPGIKKLVEEELDELGRITSAEKKVATVFCITSFCWIFRPFLSNYIEGLSDAGIAITAAILLFIIPENFTKRTFILSWDDTKDTPWGVLILFGGGLSLASAISQTGLSEWIGYGVSGLKDWPVLVIVLLTVVAIIVLTEITSNTATAAAFIPILASVAVGIGQNPLLLIIPAALAASCAFMLPVATPPNAIIYGSGKINISEMVKAGSWLNLFFILLITGLAYTLLTLVFEVNIGELPHWITI